MNYIILIAVLAIVLKSVFTGQKGKAKNAKVSLLTNPVFSPSFYAQMIVRYGNQYKESYINALIYEANMIDESKGIILTDSNKMYNVVRSFQSKVEIALVNKVLITLYGKSMPEYLGKLNNETIIAVNKIIDSLPEFVVPTGKDRPPMEESLYKKALQIFGL
jgi:hypothetical protein